MTLGRSASAAQTAAARPASWKLPTGVGPLLGPSPPLRMEVWNHGEMARALQTDGSKAPQDAGVVLSVRSVQDESASQKLSSSFSPLLLPQAVRSFQTCSSRCPLSPGMLPNHRQSRLQRGEPPGRQTWAAGDEAQEGPLLRGVQLRQDLQQEPCDATR
ncbi:hypothetical protein Vafri_16279 [Volvox africanus]|uniref:Uncharacterized protein n=1 Tax=Volvox africanus TaxID=51714 RepID=A0A8J4BIJ5_9CHLO|nr:hypothetical protein Vafri_16279 [Volvox africanus]